MIDSFKIANVDTTYSLFINTDTIPLHDFDCTVNPRNITNREKAQQQGVWPTTPLRGTMEIHVEGDIFGTDSEDYFAKRISLVKACYGDAETAPNLTARKLGDLQILFAGATETWKCPYIISAFSAPLGGLSPSRSAFAITFVSFVPYFVGMTSATKYYFS